VPDVERLHLQMTDQLFGSAKTDEKADDGT
jgi:hypothetical protein